MIEVYIIDEIERERRRDKRDQLRVWLPIEEPTADRDLDDSPDSDPSRVIVIDL
jgi:hypothetical protein